MAAPAAASPAPAPPPAASQWERLEWAAHARAAGSALRRVSASGALRGEAVGGPRRGCGVFIGVIVAGTGGDWSYLRTEGRGSCLTSPEAVTPCRRDGGGRTHRGSIEPPGRVGRP